MDRHCGGMRPALGARMEGNCSVLVSGVPTPLFPSTRERPMPVATGIPRDEKRAPGSRLQHSPWQRPGMGSRRGAGTTVWGCGVPFSYQSLMPVVTGTPRDENGRRVLGCSIVRGSDRGTGFRLGGRNDGLGRLSSIFVPIAHAGCDRHHQGMKMGLPGCSNTALRSRALGLDTGFRRNDGGWVRLEWPFSEE